MNELEDATLRRVCRPDFSEDDRLSSASRSKIVGLSCSLLYDLTTMLKFYFQFIDTDTYAQ
jgi:hypothetical protein